MWEVAFSLLLPAFVFAVRGRSRLGLLLIALAALSMVFVGSLLGIAALTLLPQFLIGAVIATRLKQLREGLRQLPAWAKGALMAVLSVAVLLSWLEWLLVRPDLVPWGWIGRVVASALIVLVFLGFRRAAAVADLPIVQWLGTVSFSLYLVHEPLIVSLRLLWPGQPPIWAFALVAVPLSLALAQVFYRLVEHPAHRLAQFVGRAVRNRLDSGPEVIR